MPVGTAWSAEEDERLAQLVRIHGPKKWSQISQELGTKGSKQCRRRWKNFLNLEERKQGSWTAEEDQLLLDGHERHGNKWTLIAQEIGGRTDNAVKNRWAALQKQHGRHRLWDVASGRQISAGNDLLGVRRTIVKDQPRNRGTVAAVDPAWLQSYQAAQVATMPLPAQLVHTQQTDTSASSSSPYRKPGLVINIPGPTATEVPYSTYGHSQLQPDASQVQRQGNGGPGLASQALGMNDSLLHVSKPQRTQSLAALLMSPTDQRQQLPGSLTSPTDQRGPISDLYKFLYGPTPNSALQHQQPTAVHPWMHGVDSTTGQGQQQQQSSEAMAHAGAPQQLQYQQGQHIPHWQLDLARLHADLTHLHADVTQQQQQQQQQQQHPDPQQPHVLQYAHQAVAHEQHIESHPRFQAGQHQPAHVPDAEHSSCLAATPQQQQSGSGQQQTRSVDCKTWGAHDLRQLLDLLGDQQQVNSPQLQQQQQGL